jgi:polyisoprenoid-binding protein YceI
MKKITLMTLLTAGIGLVAFKNPSIKNSSGKEVKSKTEHLIGTQITYDVDVQQSSFIWTAKKVTGEHTGTIKIAEGKIYSDKGMFTGGEFSIDMNSLKDTDLTDEGYNAKLTGHLKSEDFFDVAKFPKTIFKLKTCAPIKDAKPNVVNYYIKGDLTIKGITKEIAFPALVTLKDKGIVASADFNIDRTDFDLKYRSGKFDPGIGDKMIYDEFNVKVNIVAEAKLTK